jgi:hypothetical protein
MFVRTLKKRVFLFRTMSCKEGRKGLQVKRRGATSCRFKLLVKLRCETQINVKRFCVNTHLRKRPPLECAHSTSEKSKLQISAKKGTSHSESVISERKVRGGGRCYAILNWRSTFGLSPTGNWESGEIGRSHGFLWLMRVWEVDTCMHARAFK